VPDCILDIDHCLSSRSRRDACGARSHSRHSAPTLHSDSLRSTLVEACFDAPRSLHASAHPPF
jgi:hypothetical protein